MVKKARYLFLFLFILCLAGCSSQKTIVHDLSEPEANNIIVFLASRGIDATKVKAEVTGAGGQAEVLWNINIDSAKATEAMAILNASGLPKRRGQSLLSIFSQGSALVPSELEEKVRYRAGLAENIASTIRKFDGVLDSDVQLSFPEQDPLNPNAPKDKVTASVYVKHTGVLDDPNTQLIPKIRRLVASAIQDLTFENVTVIPERARFSDIPYRQALSSLAEDKEYRSIWSVVVATESVTRFRLFFFGFIITIFLLFVALIWVVWKVFPLIESAGGLNKLFNATPLTPDMLGVAPPPEEEKKDSKEEKKSKKKNEEEAMEEPDLEGAETMGADEEPEEEES